MPLARTALDIRRGTIEDASKFGELGSRLVIAGELVEEEDYELHWTKKLGAWLSLPGSQGWTPPVDLSGEMELEVSARVPFLPPEQLRAA